jgi:hypothetical protein
MLIAKGYDIELRLASEGHKPIVRPPKSYAMLHDPSGRDWPSCSVLITPFRKGRQDVEDALAEEYFGYEPKAGAVIIPSRDLGNWKKWGEVAEIDYWRPGEHRGDWWHPFGEGWWIFPGGKLPLLYKQGRLLRMEFTEGCELSWRGFVYP